MKLSEIIEKMIESSLLEEEDFARILSVKPSSFKTKMSLNRFSISELVAITEICGGRIDVYFPDETREILDPEDICDELLAHRIQSTITNLKKISMYKSLLQEVESAHLSISDEHYKHIASMLKTVGFDGDRLADFINSENSPVGMKNRKLHNEPFEKKEFNRVACAERLEYQKIQKVAEDPMPYIANAKNDSDENS